VSRCVLQGHTRSAGMVVPALAPREACAWPWHPGLRRLFLGGLNTGLSPVDAPATRLQEIDEGISVSRQHTPMPVIGMT